MSGLKCKGLVYTTESLTATMTSEGKDTSLVDPSGLYLMKEGDFDGLPEEEAVSQKQKDDIPITWKDLVGVCKAWGEAREYGKTFCCTGAAVGGDMQEGVQIVDATEVENQDPLLLFDEFEMIVYSEIIEAGAAGKLGVVTTLVATMVFMN